MEKHQFESDYYKKYNNGEVRKMNVIFGKILNELNEERYTTSNEISMRIGKSDKTVRNKINELNSLLLTNGAQIRVVKGSGYILEVNDRQAYEVFLKESLVKNLVNLQRLSSQSLRN